MPFPNHAPRPTITASLVPLVLLACGVAAPPAHAIVGGHAAARAEPYDGSFQRIDSLRGSRHVCGATLVAPQWALTAGHCTGLVETRTSLAETGSTKIALSGNPVGWRVRFGSRRVDSGGRSVAVAQFVRVSRTVAPTGDVALLRLAHPIDAAPAALATRRPTPGARAELRGWGYTGRGGLRDYEVERSYPSTLRAATTQVGPRKRCGLPAGEGGLCIGTDAATGPDNMDSGGPVFVTEPGRGLVLAGTVNGGNYVSGLRPAVYTDVSAHRRWIADYTTGRRRIPGPQPTTSPGIAGSGTILGGCAASVVRVAASRPSDPAMLLTNGHCVTPRPAPGRAYTDRPANEPVTLNGATSNVVARATTARLLYATMTGTDVAIYRLRETFAQLDAAGVPSHVLATAGPAPGTALVMHAGSYQTTYGCTVGAVVPAVRESGYTQRDALRYATASSCEPQPGTSGSPLIDRRTGEVVAVHNSHVVGDGKPCEENNPCEVAADGSTTAIKGRGYAQQVAGLTACLDAGSVFSIGKPECTLTARGVATS